jgi:hypothetical protein
MIVWHVNPLPGNERGISICTTAVTRQRPVDSSRGAVFSLRSVLRYSKQDKLGVAVSYISDGVQLLWAVTVRSCSWGRGQFGNPEEGERPPLKAAAKQRLVRTVTDWEDLVCHILICEVCRTVTAWSLLVVTGCKSTINPITNPNLISSHNHVTV